MTLESTRHGIVCRAWPATGTSTVNVHLTLIAISVRGMPKTQVVRKGMYDAALCWTKGGRENVSLLFGIVAKASQLSIKF